MKIRLLTILGLSANLFLIGCADDQARQQIADTNQRLDKIQQNVGTLDNKVSNQKELDLLNQLNDMQNQIDQLNGRVSNLEQKQKTGQGNQNQQLQALELRVQGLESGSYTGNNSNITPTKPAQTSPKANYVDKGSLQAAIKKIQNNQIPEAVTELKSLLNNPNRTTAIEARYFLSVAYAANGDYKEAIHEANRFIAEDKNNKYAPDALRVIYIAESQLGNSSEAQAAAKRLIKTYPHSNAAKKVKKQLGSN